MVEVMVKVAEFEPDSKVRFEVAEVELDSKVGVEVDLTITIVGNMTTLAPTTQ
jgi:hypothetical protein